MSNTPENTEQLQANKGQFAKGQSGNPRGKPKGSRNKITLAVQALLEGEAEAISRKAIELAKEGDMTAIKLVLERILPPRKDAPVTFELERTTSMEAIAHAMNRILQATSEGSLTPDEARKIAALIEQQRKNIQSATLEQKLDALQALLLTNKQRG